MNELVTIKNVRGYIDEKGVAYLNLEDVARGLGFTTVAISGNKVIRWQRVAICSSHHNSNSTFKYLAKLRISFSCIHVPCSLAFPP